jgi:phospholipid/cholesterol/gamma-HCH transport system substrate-binding protein
VDDKVNYSAVGAFVLVLGAVLVAAVLWLAAGLGGQRAVDTYQAFIQESVAGLAVDAPVKYLGVDVGKVDRIEIDPQDSRRVRLRFLIERGTPIKQDSLAVLKTQGLTGIAYIELNGGSPGSLPLVAGADGAAPTIPFKLSLGARLESVLTAVLANVDRMSTTLNAMFDNDNRLALKAALTDIAVLSHSLATQRGAITAALADVARTAQLAARAAEQLDPTLATVTRGAAAVEVMAAQAGDASLRAARAADSAASGVAQLGSETLPELARLMGDLGELATSLRQLSDQTSGNPNSLLIGRPVAVPGPGESARP